MGASCNAPVHDCTWSTFDLDVAQGDSGAVDVTFTAGPTGTIGNTHFDAVVNDQQTVSARGVVYVQAAGPPPAFGVAVSPAETTVTVPGGSRRTQRFWVKNTGTMGTRRYEVMGAACNYPVTDCVWSTFSLDIAQGDSGAVDVTFTAGPDGTTGTTHFDAVVNDAQTVRARGVVYVQAVAPPPPDGLVVIPSSGTEDIQPYGRALTKTFLVKNTSGRTVDISIQGADCQPAEMSCAFSTQSLSGVAPNADVPVTVTFTSGAPGWSGTIAFVARINDNQSVSAATALTVRVPPQAWLETRSLNPGTTVARGACVSFTVATSAAYECGDLRVVHVLPSLRVRGEDRTPVLLYNTAHAEPRPVVLADVSAPAGGATNVSASLTVRRGGTVVQVVSPVGLGSIGGASTRRIALTYDASNDTTGVYPYTMTVTMTVNGAPQTLTASDTLVVVNRKSSPFGAGWWLAGYEQLVRLPGGGFLWVGGDGSARRYVRDTARADEAYGAAGVDRPDSLVLEGTTYVRKLRHRARVEFDQTGRHVATRDPLGFATTFEPDPASGRLAAVLHPGASAPRHRFYYSGSTPLLDSVTGPSPSTTGPQTRKVVLTHAQRGKVTRITDADGRFVTFGYGSPNSVVVTSRTNRNAVTQSFGLATNRLVQATVPLNATESAVTTFCPAEIRGLASGGCGTSPLPASDAVTTIDGPRPASDVNDVTTIKTDRFGAPTVVTDALGNSTRLYRGRRDLAGLVTRVVHKNGWANDAFYDAKGLLTKLVEYAPLGPGHDAVTEYAWDPKWERVTQVIFPEQNVLQFAYDTATGNRIWQQDGRGTASRVDFAYNGSTGNGALLPASITYAADPAGVRARDTLMYDALGNLAEERRAVGTSSEGIARYGNDNVGRLRALNVLIDGTGAEQVDSTTYDVMDRIILTQSFGPAMSGAPAATLSVRREYDNEGNERAVTRWGSPDLTAIDSVTSRVGYDLADRAVADTAPDLRVETRVYDLAGSVTSVTTRRGHTMSMQYDALNRLLRRVVPSVTYTDTTIGLGAVDATPFPRKPNSGNDYVVPADTETFAYDAMGQTTTANNRDARVTRDYFANGLMSSERLELRNARTSTFGHNYLTQYRYDLNGRRTLIRLPNQLTTGTADSIAYLYEQATGELQTIRDPLERDYTYSYTLRGEPKSLTMPGQYEERWAYFSDGTLRTDSIHNIGATTGGRVPLPTLRASSFTYDRRGKRLTTDDTWGYEEFQRFAYTGLGYVTSSYMRQNGLLVTNGGTASEVYRSGELLAPDAFGNLDSASTVDTTTINGIVANASRRGRQATFQPNVGRLLREASAEGAKRYVYDPSGNLELSIREEASGPGDYPRENRFTYYGADERVRAVDARSGFPGDADEQFKKWTFEEYRYDALGRRVWVLSERESEPITTGNLDAEWLEASIGALRRTVWDGEQELFEVQVPYRLPGGQPQPDSVLENDAYAPQLPHFGLGNDPNPYFGRVLYVHGLAVDQPVAIVRYNYVDFFNTTANRITFPPTSISLFWNTFGKLGPTVCGDGRAACTLTSGERTAVMGVDVPSNWFVLDRPKYASARRYFQGTLTADKQDATGTLFRRNRYYDPSTGRFTQEDPIGLAGGLNLYGFAGGDPVTYSDPFGLFECDKRTGEGCSKEYRRLLGADRPLEQVTKDIEIAKTVLAVLNRTIAAAEAGEMLYRFGLEWESAGDLAKQAAAAEATGRFPHGVSVWNRTDRPDALAAPRNAVQEFFRVENTGRRGHRTIVLPRPVTREEEVIFNTLFGRTPPNQR